VHGAGRVRRDELQVDPLPGEAVGVAVLRTGQHDGAGQLTGRRRVQADVEEPWTGDLHRLHARLAAQLVGQRGGQLARGDPDLLTELQGQRGRVVAVLRVAGSLDRRGRRQRGGVEVPGGEHGPSGGKNCLGKLGGSH
jgi:hypothetical protein